MLVTEYLD